MIDFHAHILPGCDHGSDGIETSLRQLALAEAAGVKTIVATPHFYAQQEPLQVFLDRRAECFRLLKEQYKGDIKILLGAEVSLCRGLDHLNGAEALCVEGTNLILLEMPLNYWSQGLEETLIWFQDDERFTPVLAHIDRYPPQRIERLLEYGILAQLNAESLVGHFHKRDRLQWIDQGSVVAIGSDIHGVRTGYTDFTKAVKSLKERADVIFARTEDLFEEYRV